MYISTLCISPGALPGKTWTVLADQDDGYNVTLPLGFGEAQYPIIYGTPCVLRMNEKYSVHVIAIISTLWKIMSSVWQFIQGFQGLFSIFTLQSLSGYQVYYNRLHLPAGPHRYLLRGAELLSQKQLRWRTLLLGSRQLCSEWQVNMVSVNPWR